MSALPARSQSVVQFSGAQAVAGNGFSQPVGATSDVNNNFYIADTGNNRVVLLTPSGGQSDWIAAGTQIAGVALKAPQAAAVDGSGNVYIADTGNNRIVERTTAGATSVVACCSSLSLTTIHPVGIAVDAAGDLWIADSLNRRIVKISSHGVQSVLPCCLNLQPANIVPAGVAVDGAGNLYIADAGNDRVVEITSEGAQATVMGAATLIAGAPLNNPLGVAVDPFGNLYVADTGNGRVVERTAAAMSSVVGSGFTQPGGVAVDVNGNVEIADTGNNRAVQVETQAVQFGMVNVCPTGTNTPAPCSRTAMLDYSFTGPVTLGTPAAVLSGKPNMDYGITAGGTCAQGHTYSAGENCTLAVQFVPEQGGVRLGAVEMIDSVGAVQSTVLASGTGEAPQVDLDPGGSIQLQCCAPLTPPTLQSVNAIAVDGSDALYFADSGNNRVVKLDASGKASTVGTGLNSPAGIAIDGAGNLFVTTLANGNAIVEITPAGTQRTIPCCAGLSPNSLNRAFSVAVDSYGNLYVGDFGNNRVVKISTAGKISEFVSSTDVLDGQTLYAPSTSVVDAKGNVYIADYSRGRVLQLSPSGQVLRVVSGLPGGPDTVAIDGAGDWYITLPMYTKCATCAEGYILENTPSGQGIALLNGNNPTGIAVDGSGNIFYTGGPSNLVGELKRNAAQAVQFATTPIGLSSSDSPKHVLMQNTGTQPLDLSGLAVTTNFGLGAGNGACTATTQLAPGTNCALPISFTPTVTTVSSGTVTVTDNTGNVPGSVQTIPLSGTALAEPGKPTVTGTVAPATLSLPAGGGGSNATLSITGQNGFVGQLTLTCSGAPVGATCTFGQPTPVIQGTAPVTDTMTILLASSTATAAIQKPARSPRPGSPGGMTLAFTGVLGTLGLGWCRRRSGRSSRLLVLCFLLSFGLMAGGLVACGGGGSPANPPYVVAVTATSPVSPGTVYALGSLQLTVQ